MSTLTGKDLNLVKPALTDDYKVTIGTDLPANFQKIDDEFTSHLADNVTEGDNPHGIVYEEGDWSPIWGTTSVLDVEYAKYIRLNNLVHLWLNITLTTKGDSGFSIAGLPYTPVDNFAVGTIGQIMGMTSTAGDNFYVRTNTSGRLDIMIMKPDGSISTANSNLVDGSSFSLQITYRI